MLKTKEIKTNRDAIEIIQKEIAKGSISSSMDKIIEKIYKELKLAIDSMGGVYVVSPISLLGKATAIDGMFRTISTKLNIIYKTKKPLEIWLDSLITDPPDRFIKEIKNVMQDHSKHTKLAQNEPDNSQTVAISTQAKSQEEKIDVSNTDMNKAKQSEIKRTSRQTGNEKGTREEHKEIKITHISKKENIMTDFTPLNEEEIAKVKESILKDIEEEARRATKYRKIDILDDFENEIILGKRKGLSNAAIAKILSKNIGISIHKSTVDRWIIKKIKRKQEFGK